MGVIASIALKGGRSQVSHQLTKGGGRSQVSHQLTKWGEIAPQRTKGGEIASIAPTH